MHEAVKTTAELDAALASGNVLVDFWATWCGPCTMMSELLAGATAAGGPLASVRVVKVNVDEAPELATKFGIVSIPALFCYRGGERLREFVGVTPIDEICAAFA